MLPDTCIHSSLGARSCCTQTGDAVDEETRTTNSSAGLARSWIDDIEMAYIVMAHIFMFYVVMAHIVMARSRINDDY